MKRFQGVTKRPGSSLYSWGIKVPADLKGQYKGQWAYRGSLGTSDLREANEKASALQAEWLARFAEQRRALNPTKVESVSADLAATLAARVRTAVLSRDDTVRDSQAGAFLMSSLATLLEPPRTRFLSDPPAVAEDLLPDPSRSPLAGLSASQAEGLANANATMEGLAMQALARRDLAAVLPLVQREALKLGVTFDASAPGAREALAECVKAYRTAWRDVVQRDAGEIIETPGSPQPAPEPRPANPKTRGSYIYLRDTLAHWTAFKRRRPETVSAAERALALYEEATGNPPMSELRRSDGGAFVAWLLAKGGASSTAADRLDYVKGFLKHAYRELEAIPRNPWEGLKIENSTESPRRPWSLENLRRLLALPLFASYELPTTWRAGLDAAYWVPLLGIFTGARISELAQLRPNDIETIDGVEVFRFTDEAAGASLKTETSRRDVPVHEELKRLGFLDYVDALREARAESLWPGLRHRSGKPGGYLSQWFGELRKSVEGAGLPDFHSFRHTVRSRLASAGVAEPTIDTLLGHLVKGSTGARVYTDRTPADLQRAINMLVYPGLVIPRVFTAPAWKPNE